MDKTDQHIALIIKQLSGEISLEEEKVLSDWLEANQENRKLYNETKQSWEFTYEKTDKEAVEINLDEEWNKIESIIDFDEKVKVVPLIKKSNSSFNWLKMAASVVIFITIGSVFYILNQPEEIELIAKNKILDKTLSDGSAITLKESSVLTFNEEYNQNVRKVKLKGEAFFEVEPDSSKPFIVEAGQMTVEVLGTSFLVKNYKNNTEVIVKSGKIRVSQTNKKSKSHILMAGEKAKFNNETLLISKSKNQDPNYISWKTKSFTFDKTELQQIVKTFNHAFNSNIVIKNKKIANCKVTVTFEENQSLESMLKVIVATENLNMKMQGKKIEISGDGCYNQAQD